MDTTTQKNNMKIIKIRNTQGQFAVACHCCQENPQTRGTLCEDCAESVESGEDYAV